MLVPVLAISAGNDTKLPMGSALNDLTKSEIVKSLYELKEEIEDHNLRRGDDTLQWEDLD